MERGRWWGGSETGMWFASFCRLWQYQLRGSEELVVFFYQFAHKVEWGFRRSTQYGPLVYVNSGSVYVGEKRHRFVQPFVEIIFIMQSSKRNQHSWSCAHSYGLLLQFRSRGLKYFSQSPTNSDLSNIGAIDHYHLWIEETFLYPVDSPLENSGLVITWATNLLRALPTPSPNTPHHISLFILHE